MTGFVYGAKTFTPCPACTLPIASRPPHMVEVWEDEHGFPNFPVHDDARCHMFRGADTEETADADH